MALRSVSFLGLIWISSLIGGVFSLPVKGFGSNNPSPAWSDFSSPGSAYHVGQDILVYIFGRVLKEYYRQEPSAWSPQNSDAKADGGVHSKYDWDMDAGDSAWSKNGGMDSGSDGYYPVPEGYSEELVPSMEEETPEEEEPVLSDVSDLDPVYHFSSRSRYQQGRRAFFLTRYNPGEPTVGSADMADSNSNGMGNGKGWPVVIEEPGKGGY
ncbi:uncharacterized protein LOC132470776 isoform X1 [Gadus macrocephalus]|uniref:uncharacterized protein LOC132470776 isoform X1 n=1 Tax=Gadus macrocephalus TaxID=80720 RepID=UPI0028CB2FA1|nr:uncharacterized protein LOC132470776 isoform X1 [Gadus macrocephalus]